MYRLLTSLYQTGSASAVMLSSRAYRGKDGFPLKSHSQSREARAPPRRKLQQRAQRHQRHARALAARRALGRLCIGGFVCSPRSLGSAEYAGEVDPRLGSEDRRSKRKAASPVRACRRA